MTAGETAKIKAPLLHYAGNDQRIATGWPACETVVKQAGWTITPTSTPVSSTASITTRQRYDAAAAGLAWQRTVDFFNSRAHLSLKARR